MQAWTAASGGSVPPNATSYGRDYNGGALYVCRAQYKGTTQVGKIGAGLTGCDFGSGNAEHSINPYEVLTADAPFFSLVQVGVNANTAPPANAIRGGTDLNNLPLYTCAVPYDGTITLGKTRADWTYCDIGFANTEIAVTGSAYTVLAPQLVPYASSDRYMIAGDSPMTDGTNAGKPVGVCTVPFGGGTQVGAHLDSTGECDVVYGGGSTVYALTSGTSVLGWQ